MQKSRELYISIRWPLATSARAWDVPWPRDWMAGAVDGAVGRRRRGRRPEYGRRCWS